MRWGFMLRKPDVADVDYMVWRSSSSGNMQEGVYCAEELRDHFDGWWIDGWWIDGIEPVRKCWVWTGCRRSPQRVDKC